MTCLKPLLVNCLSVFFQFSIVVVNHNRFCQFVKKVNPILISNFSAFLTAIKFYCKFVAPVMGEKPVLDFLKLFYAGKLYVISPVFIDLILAFSYFQILHAPFISDYKFNSHIYNLIPLCYNYHKDYCSLSSRYNDIIIHKCRFVNRFYPHFWNYVRFVYFDGGFL